MAILKINEIEKMSENERNEKIKDLKIELVKSKLSAAKSGKLKIKEVRRTIARLLTFNRLKNQSMKK